MKTYMYRYVSNPAASAAGYTHEAHEFGRIVGMHGPQVGEHATPPPTGIFMGCDGAPNNPEQDGYRLVWEPRQQ